MDPARGVRWQAMLRMPLLHFLLLGGALFALQPRSTPALTLEAGQRDRLRQGFERREARPPTGPELAALIDRAIDEEVLVREAWRSGRLRHDGTVVNRLVLLGRFLGPEREAAPEAALRRARELGLDRSDPVIRRYLAERTRLALASEADHPPPDRAALAAHLAAHRERFRIPERLRFVHVFVSARRPHPTARAAAIGHTLTDTSADGAATLGDPFPRGPRILASRAELARDFGAEFVGTLDPAARGRWQGPLPSAYGLHWVRLEDPVPARDPRLDEVLPQVQQDLLETRRARHLRRRLDELRASYQIHGG